MKIIKVNDNLKINVELIYSIEKRNNQSEINEWLNKYNENIKIFSTDPPELYITEDKLFKPEFEKVNSKEDIELYTKALDFYITEIIGDKPQFEEEYYFILSTGLKIHVDKIIYDTVDTYFNSIIEKDLQL